MFQDEKKLPITVIYMFQDQCSKLTINYIFQDQEPPNLILTVQNVLVFILSGNII